MLKNLLYIFAAIGLLSICIQIVQFFIEENRTQSYWNNCEKVEIGMKLNEAREIIGDLKYQYWTQDSKSGEIIIYEKNGELEYSIEYDMIFAGSDNMRLIFDPKTLKITDKFCGE
ncbi:hypothetical protein [Christiangramia sabulilitoris]|uniref:Uncharacterized protein n=1 Tax=Christiangramia sabulilitoris TaxID=2583991 RepID=A0A550I751_9FLAO|nr:hypothetical protein [Christiangramia sabulilitoris]TRO66804.1 hypothetical protein FGM01_02620 [Christiangramia sabulilitoris]